MPAQHKNEVTQNDAKVEGWGSSLQILELESSTLNEEGLFIAKKDLCPEAEEVRHNIICKLMAYV